MKPKTSQHKCNFCLKQAATKYSRVEDDGDLAYTECSNCGVITDVTLTLEDNLGSPRIRKLSPASASKYGLQINQKTPQASQQTKTRASAKPKVHLDTADVELPSAQELRRIISEQQQDAMRAAVVDNLKVISLTIQEHVSDGKVDFQLPEKYGELDEKKVKKEIIQQLRARGYKVSYTRKSPGEVRIKW